MTRTKANPASSLDGETRSTGSSSNEKLDALLAELKDLLSPMQEAVNYRFESPRHPVALIIGPPRSGSTVFLQFLAATGAFAYPTNMLTRFAYAPYVGALIQKMLFDKEYDFQGEFGDIQSGLNYHSDLGKSQGPLATSEFYHFWRCYVPGYFPKPFTRDELGTIDHVELSKALASIESAFEKPFVAKGMLLQFNLQWFFEKMPFVFFIRLTRDPLFVTQSLIESRERYYGCRETWWSTQPKEYDGLRDLDVYHQIAGQVFYTERAIDEGLKEIPEKNQLHVRYEEFCESPADVFAVLAEKYRVLGYELRSESNAPSTFECGNTIRLPGRDIEGLESAYRDFASGRFSLEGELSGGG